MSRNSIVVYPRIRSIVADKPDGQTWEHKFKPGTAIIGRGNGTLSIKSNRGSRLHKMFDYKGGKEPFLINPPSKVSEVTCKDCGETWPMTDPRWHTNCFRKPKKNRKNPLLQILNPPRRKSMRTGRMPAGLARYWATHSRKKARANPRRKRRAKRNAWFESRKHLTVPSHRAPRHRKAALLGRNRRHMRRFVSQKFSTWTSPAKGASTMARRRRRHNPVASNYRRRTHHRSRRRNPPNRIQFMSLGKQAAGVGVGIIAPSMILQSKMLPAGLIDSMPKRIIAKLAIGYLVSRAGAKFVGGEFGKMILIGTAANILMADVFPRLVPQAGMGLSEGYEDLPMLSGGYSRGAASWEQPFAGMGAMPDEEPGMNEFPDEIGNVNEFAV